MLRVFGRRRFSVYLYVTCTAMGKESLTNSKNLIFVTKRVMLYTALRHIRSDPGDCYVQNVRAAFGGIVIYIRG